MITVQFELKVWKFLWNETPAGDPALWPQSPKKLSYAKERITLCYDVCVANKVCWLFFCVCDVFDVMFLEHIILIIKAENVFFIFSFRKWSSVMLIITIWHFVPVHFVSGKICSASRKSIFPHSSSYCVVLRFQATSNGGYIISKKSSLLRCKCIPSNLLDYLVGISWLPNIVQHAAQLLSVSNEWPMQRNCFFFFLHI